MSGRKADGLEIPAHLRQTEVNRDLVDRIIRQDDKREWVMPDQSKYNKSGEAQMAKTPEIECEDPELPVKVSLMQATGQAVTKEFGDMAEFGAWFDPKLHVVEQSEAGDSETLVAVREKTKPAPKGKKAADPDKGPALTDKVIEEVMHPPEKAPGKKKAAKKAKSKSTPVVSPGGMIKPPERAIVSRGAVIKPAPKAAAKAAAKKPAKRGRMVRHGCKVNGVEYSSAWDAFQKLKLGTASDCIRFRTILKASKTGRETYEKGGKKYPFIRTDKE